MAGKNLKAIIFDMDGLLVDTERLYIEVDRIMLDNRGIEVTESELDRVIAMMMGKKPLEALTIFSRELGLGGGAEELLVERDLLMEEKLKNDLKPMHGVFEILEAFHGKKKLAIATGSPGKFMNMVVNGLGIREFFDVLQSSDGVKKGKPDPEIYLETVTKLGINPEECAVLEDSENGVEAGEKAGCYVIAIPTGHTENQDFSKADFRAKNLLDARNHLLVSEKIPFQPEK